jgi:hypothetical protein
LLSNWEEALDSQLEDVLEAFCYVTDYLKGIKNEKLEMECPAERAERYKKLLRKLR